MLQTCKNLVQSSITCNPYKGYPCLSNSLRKIGRCECKTTHSIWLRNLSGTKSFRNRPSLANDKSDDATSNDVRVDKLSIDSNRDSIKETQSEDNSIVEHKDYYNALQREMELPAEYKSPDIGFWESEKGLVLKDQIFTGVGRVLRMFISKERSDNWYESAMVKEFYRVEKFNRGDDQFLKEHGPEWAFGLIVFQLGGAVKVKYDDRWVDDVRCLRTPKRKDFRIEAVDFRKSAINHIGLKYLSGTKHIRYINAGDAKCFDDQSMACLHSLADSLEFLDISGTNVSEKGFGYLRLFSKLRFLNISRLKNGGNMERLMPYLLEVLPDSCCIITNDETPSDMYGVPIPFRHPKNPKKDLPVTEGNKKIGDLIVYERDMHAVDFYRAETIHELWMTPLMGRLRQSRLYFQQDLDNNFTHKLVHYIIKANNYKPLL